MNINGGFSKSNETSSIRRCHELNCPSTHCQHNNDTRPRIISAPSSPIPQRPIIYLDQISPRKSFARKEPQLSSNGRGFEWMELPKSPRGINSPGHTPMRFPKGKENSPGLKDRVDFDATQAIEPDRDLTPTLPATPTGTLNPSGFFSSPPELQKSDLLAEVCKSLERTQDTLRKCRTPVMDEGRITCGFRHEKPSDERKRENNSNTTPVKASRTLRFDPNPQIRMRTSSDVSSEELNVQGSSKDYGEYKKMEERTSPRDIRALSRKQGLDKSVSPGSNFGSSLRSKTHGEDKNYFRDALLDISGEVYDSLVMRKQESIENDRSQSEILVEREDTIPSRDEFDPIQGRSDVISPYRQILLRNREVFERVQPRKLDFEGNTSGNERNNGQNAKFKQIPIRPKDIMDRKMMNPTRLEGPPSYRSMAASSHIHLHQHFEANFSSSKLTSKDTVAPKQQYIRILKNIYSHKVDLLIQEEKEAQIRQDRRMELMVIQKKKNVVKELAERIQQFKTDCKVKRFSETQIDRMIVKEQSNLDEMENKIGGLLEAARKRNEILVMKKGHKGEYSNYSQYSSSVESIKKPPVKLDAGTSPHLPGQVPDHIEKKKFKFEPKRSSSSSIFETNIREKGDKIGSGEPPDSSRSTQYDITSIETDPSTPIQKSPSDHGEDGEKTPIPTETSERELRAYSEEDKTDDLFHTPKKNRGFKGFPIPKLNLDFLDDGNGIDDTLKVLGMQKEGENDNGSQNVLEELESQQKEPERSQSQKLEIEVTQEEYSQESPLSALENDNTLEDTFKRAMEESFLGGVGIDFRLGQPRKGAATIVQEKDAWEKKDQKEAEKSEERKEYGDGNDKKKNSESEEVVQTSNEAIRDVIHEVNSKGKIEENEEDLDVKTAELLDKEEEKEVSEHVDAVEVELEGNETKENQEKVEQRQQIDDELEKRQQEAEEVYVEKGETQKTAANEDVNQLLTAIQDFHLETFEKQHGRSEEKEEIEAGVHEKLEEPVQTDSPSAFSSLRSDLPISEDFGLDSPKIDDEIDKEIEQNVEMEGNVEELPSLQREPTESSEEPKSQAESAESRGRSSESNGSHRRRRSLIPQLQRLESGSKISPSKSVDSPDSQPLQKSKIPRRRSSVGSELPESLNSPINDPTTVSSTQSSAHSSIPEQLETAKSSSSESTAKESTSSSGQSTQQSTQRTSTDSGGPSRGQGGSKGSSARSGHGTMNSGSDSIPEDVTTARDSDSLHSTSLVVPSPPSGQSDSAISSLSTPRIFSLSHPNAMRSPKEKALTIWPKAQRSADNNSLLSLSINSSRANDSLLHTGEVNPRWNGLVDIVEMNTFSHLDYDDKMQSWYTDERTDALVEYFTIKFYQKLKKYRKRLLSLEKIENFKEIQVHDELLEKEVPEEDMLEVVLIIADNVAYFMNQAVHNQMTPSERNTELYDVFRDPTDENMVKYIKKKIRLLTEVYPQPYLRTKWELTSIERKVDYTSAEERLHNDIIKGKISERAPKKSVPYP